MEEVWKDVRDYEGYYQVSNMGNVRRVKKSGEISKKLKLEKTENGYLRVTLSKEGISKHIFVHKLVAEAFILNLKNKPFVDHINTIKSDNRVENLRWVTNKENSNNGLTRKHLSDANRGENNPMYGRKGENAPMYGKSHTEKTRKKLSELNKGKKLSEETKAKLSKKVVSIDTKGNVEVYESTMDAERKIKAHHGLISASCKGKRELYMDRDWYYLADICDIYFFEGEN